MLTRRGFLRLGLSSLGGTALFGSGGASKASATPVQFCIPTLLYPECSLEHALEHIARTGCTGVDLWDSGSGRSSNPMQWIATHGPGALADLVHSFGLRVSAFSLFWTPGAALVDRLRWLRDAGGELAIVNGGGAPGRPVSEAVGLLAPLVDRAAGLGVRIAAANHRGTSLASASSIRDFVERSTSPSLGIALAPHHLAVGDEVSGAVAAAGNRLYMLYAPDGAPKTPSPHRPGTQVCLLTRARMPAAAMTRALASARERLTRTWP